MPSNLDTPCLGRLLVIDAERRPGCSIKSAATDVAATISASPECPLVNLTKAHHDAAFDTRSMIQAADYGEVSVETVLSFVNAIGVSKDGDLAQRMPSASYFTAFF